MLQPAIPADESGRLAALRQLSLLDTPAEERFDRITRIARTMFDVPIALVSLVDADRQWFKSRQGIDAAETPRQQSFCGHAILGSGILLVPDAHADARFADNPLVTGPPFVRFYAGAPLSAPDGHRIGTLCLIDQRPRRLGDEQLARLRDLADCLESEISRVALQAAADTIAGNEAQLNAVFDNVAEGIVTFDAAGRIHRVNPAARSLFGGNDDELVGSDAMALLVGAEHQPRLVDVADWLGRVREATGRRRDGSQFPMSVSLSEFDLSGQKMYSAIVRDISDRKKVERLKSEFVSTVSHELRTPLTSIRGALGLVIGRFGSTLPEKARRMIEMADRNSERLTLLINDILDLEKIKSGSMRFEFKPVNLAQLMQQALGANEGAAAVRQVRLNCHVAVRCARVWGDPNRILQVFANLVSNAVKFTPAGGVVELGLIETAAGFRATVRDHGPGIAPEFRDRIFQRFAQADSSDARERGGTGLGLSISKAIVERHGGRIGFDSRPGEGAEFHFELPQWQGRIERPRDGPSGASVLVCEDCPDVAQILCGFLDQEGHGADIAATGADARALLAAKRYELMLLDLALPDMDGLQLLQELRADARTQAMPVIVVSGRALETRPDAGAGLNVVDWLQKPIDRRRFGESVGAALRGAHRRRILHVEDDQDVVQIAQAVLQDLADISHVATVQEACRRLAEDRFDLVLLDLTLADGSGAQVLDALDGRCPVVIFSGTEPGTEVGRQVMATLAKTRTSNEQLAAVIKDALCVS